jgi:hypothetical protein
MISSEGVCQKTKYIRFTTHIERAWSIPGKSKTQNNGR